MRNFFDIYVMCNVLAWKDTYIKYLVLYAYDQNRYHIMAVEKLQTIDECIPILKV